MRASIYNAAPLESVQALVTFMGELKMSADDDLLKPLRERIDALDGQLLALLNERAQCALEVGKIKENQPPRQIKLPAFYRPERVAQILRRLTEKIPGRCLTPMLRRCFER